MKGIAKGILAVIIVFIFLQPIVEVINVLREKIIISSAVWNACNAAAESSIVYENFRDRDVVIDEELFKEYFAEAFENAMDADYVSSEDILTFVPYNDIFNDITVYISFDAGLENELMTVKITARAETLYKYKTNFLQLTNRYSNLDFNMICERSIFLRNRN